MAQPTYLNILKQGVDVWNKWRHDNPIIIPNLSGADLREADLREADLSGVDLSRADLRDSCLKEAILFKTILRKANLEGADLHEADLRGADLRGADLRGVNLGGANLPEWDEFHDPQIIDWKRVRGVIEHEDILTNHRFTWLLASQTILLTAFGSIWTAQDIKAKHGLLYNGILIVLSIVGMLIAYYIWVHLLAGKVYHDDLVKWWNEKYGKKNAREIALNDGRHPKICGHLNKWYGLELYTFPWFFFILWLIILLLFLIYR